MIERYSHNNLTWYDVLSPSSEEVRILLEEASIPIELTGDLTTMTPRTATDCQKGVIKITSDWPTVKRTDLNHPHELKCIATKDALITIRFEDMQAVDQWRKDFEVISLLKRSGSKTSGAHLLLTFLSRLYKSLDTKLDYLESKLREIESQIFDEQEKAMVYQISQVGRRIISFKQTISSHERALGELYTGMPGAFSKTLQSDVLLLSEQLLHLNHRLDRQTTTLDELRETNNALLTTKQNEIMKILTIMAFITFPLTLFTSMFGMNTTTTPLLGREGDFWIILGIMVVVSIAFFGYFKYKKWM